MTFKEPNKEAKRLLAYWAESIDEGERAEISIKEILANGLETSFAELEHGIVSAHCVRVLREKENSGQKKVSRQNENQKTNSNNKPIRALICPLRFSRTKRGSNNGPRGLELLWMPAIVSADGKLLPPTVGAPWIPRAYLEPLTKDDTITVGSTDSLYAFANKYAPTEWSSWSEYWNYAEKLVVAVTGSKMRAVSVEDYEREVAALITLDTTSSGYRDLATLLEEVSEGVRHPGLVPHFVKMKDPERKNYTWSKRQISRSANKHSGQFGNKFPLAHSQRLAVHRFMETEKGDFLTVTGPPGTGKTTLLQSIIASLWVNAITSGHSRPPVIVACGATNQAVTNIIDSLEKTSDDDDLLASRWLPSVHSFGTFCCSATKARDIQGYQLELRNGEGISAEMETPEYITEATAHFLRCYSSWNGEVSRKNISLKKALADLQRKIIRVRGVLYSQVLLAKDGKLSDWVKSFIGLGPKISQEELFAALSRFDTSIRYKTFLLASHYWEARWLMEVAELRAFNDSKSRFRGAIQDWQRRAMVTPTFVSTISMLPRFFAARFNRDNPPIDVLIFDEAGQVPVELGVACMSLAKKAVIVGDCEQLEPVWGVAPHIDRANAVRHKLLRDKDADAWSKLERRGVISSSGSLMYLALRSTKWIEENTYGVFLSEHRRSVPKLVEFANAIAYRNRLEPCREETPERILPAIGYMHVQGSSQQVGQSRSNRIEVDRIATWLEQRQSELLKFYGVKSLSEVVAVITPFAAQTKTLEARLRPRYPEMTIGTVNSLQGAERRIVVFSSVYDCNFEGRYFFDRGTNMLNVAVTRAQDSFLVFGDMRIFDPAGQNPSSILARFLFEDPENELVDAGHGRVAETPADEIRRLTKLEEHQEVLFEALESAKREVIICSPTISSVAILHDKIPVLIEAARSRNVVVHVFTDSYLDLTSEGTLKPASEEGRKLLIAAGANVYVAKAIHNKAVAVDDHTLIEGSFNWLSAVRTIGSRHQKFEVSTLFRGPGAKKSIKTLREELEHRSGLL